MKIRAYRPSDCAQLAKLFHDTVHTVNAGDYTQEQLDAWAGEPIDVQAWNETFLKEDTLIAVNGSEIVGFGSIDVAKGLLDMLFVHKDHQGQGIATKLCNQLECAARGEITVHASITARRFFEKRGYEVISEQNVFRKSTSLTNFVMRKR